MRLRFIFDVDCLFCGGSHFRRLEVFNATLHWCLKNISITKSGFVLVSTWQAVRCCFVLMKLTPIRTLYVRFVKKANSLIGISNSISLCKVVYICRFSVCNYDFIINFNALLNLILWSFGFRALASLNNVHCNLFSSIVSPEPSLFLSFRIFEDLSCGQWFMSTKECTLEPSGFILSWLHGLDLHSSSWPWEYGWELLQPSSSSVSRHCRPAMKGSTVPILA